MVSLLLPFNQGLEKAGDLLWLAELEASLGGDCCVEFRLQALGGLLEEQPHFQHCDLIYLFIKCLYLCR